MIGAPIQASLKLLPDAAERIIYSAVDKSLEKALELAVTSLGSHDNLSQKPRLMSHKLLAGLSGAAGGALGGLSVAAELPLSTMLILRSVADIARSQGERPVPDCGDGFGLWESCEMDLGPDAARLQDVPEIRRQPIGAIDHGRGDATQGKPQGDPGLRAVEAQLLAPCRAE